MGESQVEILTTQDMIRRAVSALPTLTTTDIPLDDSCAICLTSFDVVLAEEAEMKISAQNEEEMIYHGVTKLVDCGHMFCRKDLLEWIQGLHGSCPTCRNVFLNIRPPSESDGESSDGDYFPNEEDDEDEEYWDDNAEEFDVDETDLEVDLDDDWDERWSAPSEIAAFAEDDSRPVTEGEDET